MRNQELFRKQALKKFTSPEQLDRALAVTSPHLWIALSSILLVFVALVGWAFLGRISTYVEGSGLILSQGGSVVDAVSVGQVRLDTVEVIVGDAVAEGDVVAIGYNDEVSQRLNGARAVVAESTLAFEAETAAVEEENRIARANDARERDRLDDMEANALVSVETTRAIFEDTARLFDDGVVSRSAMERSREDMNRAHREHLAVLRERDSLDAAAARRENTNAARTRDATARLEQAERQLRELEVLAEAHRVLAPVAGRVTEIKVAVGMLVSPGQSIISIQRGGGDLEALVYITPAEGSKVQPGMDVLISPSTVRREEFGSIRGTVERISQFPVSMEGIMAELQNRELARMFSEDGAPYSGRIALNRDATTASGLEWTSPKASEEVLNSGTLATVEIRTDAQPPIALVIPAIREFFGT